MVWRMGNKFVTYGYFLILIQAVPNTNRKGLMSAHSFPVPEKVCLRNASWLGNTNFLRVNYDFQWPDRLENLNSFSEG
jgi:hypothetical protein